MTVHDSLGQSPTSDVFDEEEEVAQLCDVDGTAGVKLDRVGSGGRRESGSMAERNREEVKYKVKSKYAVNRLAKSTPGK